MGIACILELELPNFSFMAGTSWAVCIGCCSVLRWISNMFTRLAFIKAWIGLESLGGRQNFAWKEIIKSLNQMNHETETKEQHPGLSKVYIPHTSPAPLVLTRCGDIFSRVLLTHHDRPYQRLSSPKLLSCPLQSQTQSRPLLHPNLTPSFTLIHK